MSNPAPKASLEKIAGVLEGVLNAPFQKGVAPKSFDKIIGDDLYDIGRQQCLDGPLLEEFVSECKTAICGHFYEGNHSRNGLRASKIGTEPILQAFGLLGYGSKESTLSNLWTVLAGHFFEAWCRFVLKCRGFKIYSGEYDDNEVSYQGIKGHYDLILETDLGRRIMVEVKHLSSVYLDGLLEPERVENPLTGNLVKTGRNLSRISHYGYDNDTRGYLTQLSLYCEATGLEGLFIFWDKRRNCCHVVPLSPEMQHRCTQNIDYVVKALNEVKTLEDVFLNFEIPKPVPQKFKGALTGKHYIPQTMRYVDKGLLDALYELDEDNYVVRVRPKEEALAAPYFHS